MRRPDGWDVGFLGVTAVAVGAEVWAAFDGNPSTRPWTEYLTDLPWWVTMPAALLLSVWLPLHLLAAYRRKRAGQPPKGTT